MKSFLKLIGVLILFAVVGVAAYFGYAFSKKQNTIPPNTFPDQISSSTPDMTASTTPGGWTYATSTLDTSSWKTYSSAELGYSIMYPGNMLTNGADVMTLFSFPKDVYFHWPLQDDAKVTVTASSSCPALTVDESNSETSTFTLNGYAFTRTESHGAAAGNLYTEIAYDTKANGVCYRIDFYDHGANGAGLYVSDPSLISQYDAQHDADLQNAQDIFNAMAQSFSLNH